MKLWKLWSKDAEAYALFIMGLCDGEDEWNRLATVLSGITGVMERMESIFF